MGKASCLGVCVAVIVGVVLIEGPGVRGEIREVRGEAPCGASSLAPPFSPLALVPQDSPLASRPHAGFQSCLRCHNSGITGQVELPGGIKLDLMKEQWVLYKEYPIWAKEDKHGQAYTVLLNERSKTMGKLLGVADIHRDRRCLACHTGFPMTQMPVEKDGLVAKDLEKKLDINLGVSCEGCHGQADDLRADNRVILKGWKDPHQVQPTLPYERTRPWRFLSPKEKSDEYGFFDVRTPSSKARLCASCHVGDVAQGRIVTHAMYAAGHPPLPGFEVETFVEQMPKHWVDFSAKSDEVRELFLKYTNDPLYKDKDYKIKYLYRSRAMLAGALMTASEYLRLAGQLADADGKSPVAKPAWPELAVFDCYACHHELKSASWRQERKPPLGVAGRPTLHDWPFALATIGLKTLGADAAELDAKLADVRKTLAAKPFGKPGELVKPAQAAARWLAEEAGRMDRKQLPRAAGAALLRDIAHAAAARPLDYDSARQLTWAFQVVAGELKDDYPNARKIAPTVAALGKETFLLNLRKGRAAATLVPGDKQERKTVEVNLEIVLPYAARYDEAALQTRFQEIADLLRQAKSE